MSQAAPSRPAALPAAARPAAVLAVLAAGLGGAMLLSFSQGDIDADPLALIVTLLRAAGLPLDPMLPPIEEAAILTIRLPRLILGAAVGAALAITGAAMQALFRNPLADPGLTGVSAGAAAAATGFIALAGGVAAGPVLFGLHMLPLVAFAGALGAILFVYGVARGTGRFDPATLLLVGVAVNAAAGVVIGIFTFLADDAALRSLVFWTMGSVASASWASLPPVLLAIGLGLVLLLREGRGLNVLALGEGDARALGLDVTRVTRRLLLVMALVTGAATALAGVVGFVGLIVPHLLRLALGADNRLLLPASALGGAIILTLSDALARSLIAPGELPLGLVTGALGTPLFLWLILTRVARVAP